MKSLYEAKMSVIRLWESLAGVVNRFTTLRSQMDYLSRRLRMEKESMITEQDQIAFQQRLDTMTLRIEQFHAACPISKESKCSDNDCDNAMIFKS